MGGDKQPYSRAAELEGRVSASPPSPPFPINHGVIPPKWEAVVRKKKIVYRRWTAILPRAGDPIRFLILTNEGQKVLRLDLIVPPADDFGEVEDNLITSLTQWVNADNPD